MDRVNINLCSINAKFHKDWIPIISGAADKISNAMTSIMGKDHTPYITDILEAFRISPSMVKVVIIGQDPYPTRGHADGLSFSTRSKVTPKSLENIFRAIVKTYATSGNTDNMTKFMKSNDLHYWLYQGVLLLNVAWSTLVNETRAHSLLWDGVTRHVITELSNSYQGIIFMLWGNDAISLSSYINNNNNHTILKWTHPSPMADNKLPVEMKFMNCNHFDIASKTYGISFCTSPTIRIYTDGSISTVNQECSYSVVYSLDTIGVISGKVRPYVYRFDVMSLRFIHNPDVSMIPTSQRGEYLAMCYALYSVIKLSLTGCNIEIHSDSRNCVMTMNEWYQNRVDKGTVHEFENIDLIRSMMSMKSLIPNITIHHIESHKSLNVEDPILQYNRRMNNIADTSAKSALTFDTFDVMFSSNNIMFNI